MRRKKDTINEPPFASEYATIALQELFREATIDSINQTHLKYTIISAANHFKYTAENSPKDLQETLIKLIHFFRHKLTNETETLMLETDSPTINDIYTPKPRHRNKINMARFFAKNAHSELSKSIASTPPDNSESIINSFLETLEVIYTLLFGKIPVVNETGNNPISQHLSRTEQYELADNFCTYSPKIIPQPPTEQRRARPYSARLRAKEPSDALLNRIKEIQGSGKSLDEINQQIASLAV